MKTVLYYTQTQKAIIYPNGYEIDGVHQPLGELATGIWHLEYISNERPEYDITTQFATYKWLPDYETNKYVQVWTIHDRDDEQLIEYLTQLGDIAVQNTKNQLSQQELENIYQQNLAAIELLGDEDALEVKEQYPPFNPNGYSYTENERFYYPVNDKLYRVLQPHTSQPDWLPTTAVSLYVEVTPAGVIADWVQPTGAHDAYQTGDKVMHNGQVWQSTVDNNTWEPGVHGWVQI